MRETLAERNARRKLYLGESWAFTWIFIFFLLNLITIPAIFLNLDHLDEGWLIRVGSLVLSCFLFRYSLRNHRKVTFDQQNLYFKKFFSKETEAIPLENLKGIKFSGVLSNMQGLYGLSYYSNDGVEKKLFIKPSNESELKKNLIAKGINPDDIFEYRHPWL